MEQSERAAPTNRASRPATPRQTFTIWGLTGIDVREANLTVESASRFIARLKNKEYDSVRFDLLCLAGAIEKHNSGPFLATQNGVMEQPDPDPTPPKKRAPKKKRRAAVTNTEWRNRIAVAHEAGLDAAAATPLAHKSLSRRLDPADPTSPVLEFIVPQEPPGEAWVAIEDSRTPFGRWLARNRGMGIVDGRGRYGGGCIVTTVKGVGPTLKRRAAYAEAFARMLGTFGVQAKAEFRVDPE